MTYILKTRAITGELVPANGQHVEYTELHRALTDGQVIRSVFGDEVTVVEYRTDAPVAFI